MLAGFLVRTVLVLLPAIGLGLGVAMSLLGQPTWQDRVWAAFTIPVLAVLVHDIVASLRRGEVGLDIVAVLSMAAALIVGEELAAIVVAPKVWFRDPTMDDSTLVPERWVRL